MGHGWQTQEILFFRGGIKRKRRNKSKLFSSTARGVKLLV